MNWGVVILAGGHETGELGRVMGTSRKALAPIGELTSLARMLKVLSDADFKNVVAISGVDVHPHVSHGLFVPEGHSAMENARRGVKALGPKVDSVLFLPADTPLITAASIREFQFYIESTVRSSRWFAAGFSRFNSFKTAYPGASATPMRFQEGALLAGAFYACTPDAFATVMPHAESIRSSRKSQLGIALKLGPGLITRYLTRRLSKPYLERKLSNILGGEVIFHFDSHPSSCLDFDTVEEYHQILELVRVRDA